MAPVRTAADHYRQAQRNAAFYQQIGGNQSSTLEWAITALFYTALHEVEAALLALNEPSSKDHKRRKGAIRSRLRAAAPAYEQLEKMSVRARYECVHHSQSDLGIAEARLAFVRQEIGKVAPPPY